MRTLVTIGWEGNGASGEDRENRRAGNGLVSVS